MTQTLAATRPWWHADWTTYVWAAVLSSIATVGTLRLWHLKLGIPYLYTGDALPTAAHVKTVLQQGWFEYEPHLGAPRGEIYFDFPQADNFHLIAVKVIGLFTDQWPVALNVYFLIGFPLAAISAVWFLRVVGVSRPLTIVLATLFAIAPYHYSRGEAHLYLASYYPIPLALVILLWVLRGERIWTRRAGVTGWWGVVTGRGAATVLIVGLLGTASQYYSLFFLILLAFAGITTLIRTGRWRRFWGAATVGAFTAVVLFLNVLPGLVYTAFNGASIDTLERAAPESEIYAFKLAQLVLPWNAHIIPMFRNFRNYYDSQYPLLSEDPALGLVAACGLLASFAILMYLTVGWRNLARRAIVEQNWFRTTTDLSSLLLVCFLFGTVGGFATFISFFTSSVRGWNRISIVMAMLSLAVVGLLVDRFLSLLTRRMRKSSGVGYRVTVVGVAGILLVVGVVDQTPYKAAASTIAAQNSFRADQTYFGALEKRIPTSAIVLQLPYISFPEDASANGTLSSDELIPFLQTNTVRWTAGGIKGRPAGDWTSQLDQFDVPRMVALAAAADVHGILVDTRAYADKGATLVRGLEKDLGQRPVTSSNGRWRYFDIAAVQQSLEKQFSDRQLSSVASDVTDPVMPYLAPDYTATTTPEGVWGGTSSTPDPHLTLDNPSKTTVNGRFSLKVANGTTKGTVTVTGPNGLHRTEKVVNGTVSFSLHLGVPPGRSLYSVTSQINGKPVPVLISHLRFIDDSVAGFLRKAGPVGGKG